MVTDGGKHLTVELSYTLPNDEQYALHYDVAPLHGEFIAAMYEDIHLLLAQQLLPAIREAVDRYERYG